MAPWVSCTHETQGAGTQIARTSTAGTPRGWSSGRDPNIWNPEGRDPESWDPRDQDPLGWDRVGWLSRPPGPRTGGGGVAAPRFGRAPPRPVHCGAAWRAHSGTAPRGAGLVWRAWPLRGRGSAVPPPRRRRCGGKMAAEPGPGPDPELEELLDSERGRRAASGGGRGLRGAGGDGRLLGCNGRRGLLGVQWGWGLLGCNRAGVYWGAVGLGGYWGAVIGAQQGGCRDRAPGAVQALGFMGCSEAVGAGLCHGMGVIMGCRGLLWGQGGDPGPGVPGGPPSARPLPQVPWMTSRRPGPPPPLHRRRPPPGPSPRPAPPPRCDAARMRPPPSPRPSGWGDTVPVVGGGA